MDGDLAAADYQRLLEYQRLLQFRTELRRFLHWSAEQAERAGLTPAQHHLLRNPSVEKPVLSSSAAARSYGAGCTPTLRSRCTW
jgi:hypothetical protein